MKRVTLANGIIARDNIQYTPTGKLQSEQRPNGLTISYTYYPGNDRLETATESDGSTSRTTHWTYLPTGEMETITLGYGTAAATTITLGYDAARRLTRITDGLGNYIEYTLDTEGNREAENAYDSTGTLHRTLTQTFDAYNRLDTTAQANESGDYNSSPDGTLDSHVDGKLTTTDYSYDALKRLISTTQDLGGGNSSTANALTKYAYNSHDDLTSVTDPKNGTTTYKYDDLGRVWTQSSPDTGTTTMTYDPAGNLKTRTDAKGQTFTYTYDALNRVTFIDAPYPLDDISYFYDSCPNGVGRLCSVTKGDEATYYSYNAFGDVTLHQNVAYSFDALGRPQTLTYPSGNQVTYHYDASGQVSGVAAIVGGVPQSIVSTITRAPFGPVRALTYGNGATLTQGLDNAYRLTSQTIPGIYQRDYTQYDANGNLQAFNDGLASQTDIYSYDALNRLTAADGGYGSQDIGYDKNGNRLSWLNNSTLTDYAYGTSNNRLSTVNTTSIVLDANGNTTNDGRHIYSYNSHNQLVDVDGTVGYRYNALGQRVSKTVSGVLTTFVYNTGGQLLGEYNEGNPTAEYVYLNGSPIAMIKQGNVYYIHTDQLGTPRAVSDQTQRVVWRWNSDAFGSTAANDDPDGDGTAFTLNLRFPGQYYDAETGLHYNYFRYYDPSTGRYITSDPIGLAGGLNTYLYVEANPLKYTDPDGLCPMCLVIPGVCAGGGCEAIGLGAIGAWWAAHNSSNGDNVIPGPWPDSSSSDDAGDNPEQCPNDDQKKKEKNCLALYNATLQSCASIKNRRAQQRCHEAAKANYEACMSQD